jgi:hypothetical protein
MQQENQTDNEQNEQAQQPGATPLEQVKEQQAAMQQSREVIEQRPDPSPEVPGASNPSNRRKHPQRQMYGSGTNES